MTAHASGIAQIDQFLNTTALLFKHSNTCDLSDERLDVAEAVVEGSSIPMVIISVQRQRALSDAIASQFNIRHASPQVIALDRGCVVDARSHWHITREWLAEMLVALHTGANGNAARESSHT